MKYSDEQLYEIMTRDLYTAVVCDCMDELNYRDQAMHESIRPLIEGSIVAGRAKTILAADVYYVVDRPYDKEIEALDSVKPGEVVVFCTNNSPNNGVWGELLSTSTMVRGGKGAIVDGLARDTRKIKELNFPVFCRGYKPVDSKGRGLVIDYDCPVVVGGIRVEPRDYIFADSDGVIVIPNGILEQVVDMAIEKVNKEKMTKKELLEGKYLKDVYEKYGVL